MISLHRLVIAAALGALIAMVASTASLAQGQSLRLFDRAEVLRKLSARGLLPNASVKPSMPRPGSIRRVAPVEGRLSLRPPARPRAAASAAAQPPIRAMAVRTPAGVRLGRPRGMAAGVDLVPPEALRAGRPRADAVATSLDRPVIGGVQGQPTFWRRHRPDLGIAAANVVLVGVGASQEAVAPIVSDLTPDDDNEAEPVD